MTKICTKCGKDKPLDAYWKSKRGKLGRRSKCIECSNAAFREWRNKQDPEYHRERWNRWARENPELIQARNKRYEERHSEDYFFYKRVSHINHTAKEFGAQDRLSSSDLKNIWERDRGSCLQCGTNEDIEFDHITPIKLGGRNHRDNLQLLCAYHNNSKGRKIADYRIT